MHGTHHRPLRGYVDICPANAPSLAALGGYVNRVPRTFDCETEGGHEQEVIPDILLDGTACNVYEDLRILAIFFVQWFSAECHRVPRDP